MSVYYSIAFGKAPGGKRGCTHTFAVWRREPTRDPFSPPDALGGAGSIEEARQQATYIAGRLLPGEPIVELKAEWARAARYVKKGEPPWPAERKRKRNERDRRDADVSDDRARSEIQAWADTLSDLEFQASQGCVVQWFSMHPDPVIYLYALIADGGKAYAALLQRVAFGERTERHELDLAELERDGRAWSPTLRTYLYAMPTSRGAGRARHRHEHRASLCVPTEAFATLGLPTDATPDDVRRAYRRLVVQERAHPDQGGNEARFIALTSARDAAVAHAEDSANLN